MKLIVGLGNPGKRYERTPHNVGFEVVDCLARQAGVIPRKRWRFRARTGEAVLEGVPAMLVKPETFMNNSGTAVAALAGYYRVAAEDILIVYDDADLALGRLRVRPSGSGGGHRGLESVIQHMGVDVARLRIGIGRRGERDALISHVLTPWRGEAWQTAQAVVARAAETVRCALREGTEAAMNRYNGEWVEAIPAQDAAQGNEGVNE